VAHVVLPHPADLEETLGDTLVAQPDLFGNPATLGIARHDRRLEPVQPELLEPVADHEHDAFGHVPAARTIDIDPVADEARLKRPAQHAPETHFADERAVDLEQSESVRGVELPLALPRAAPTAERVAVEHGIG